MAGYWPRRAESRGQRYAGAPDLETVQAKRQRPMDPAGAITPVGRQLMAQRADRIDTALRAVPGGGRPSADVGEKFARTQLDTTRRVGFQIGRVE